MKISEIDLTSYPNSEKIYVPGKLHPIKVAMRKVRQYPTVKIEDGKRVEYPNEDGDSVHRFLQPQLDFAGKGCKVHPCPVRL